MKDNRLIYMLFGAFIDVLSGFGILLMVSPYFIYQFITGNEERYLWIINGPAPFNQLGSGPYQMWLYVFLILIGIFLFVISRYLKKTIYR